MISGDQKTKEQATAALLEVMEICDGDDAYPVRRYHIAAALMAGADPNTARYCQSLLQDAVIAEDIELCRLLLACKANVNERGLSSLGTPLFLCRTVPMAQLLLAGQADVRHTLLNTVAFNHQYDAELIRLYKTHGASVLSVGNARRTVLHSLV